MNIFIWVPSINVNPPKDLLLNQFSKAANRCKELIVLIHIMCSGGRCNKMGKDIMVPLGTTAAWKKKAIKGIRGWTKVSLLVALSEQFPSKSRNLSLKRAWHFFLVLGVCKLQDRFFRLLDTIKKWEWIKRNSLLLDYFDLKNLSFN